MTSSDILAYIKQVAPDLQKLEAALLNFIDQANRRLIKKVLWPDCWMTTMTVANQQEYTSLPVLQVHAVYVGGQEASQTDRATLEGRQIDLYSQVPSPSFPFVTPSAGFAGFIQITGPLTPGDILTTVLGGIPLAYVVKVTDADLRVLVGSIASALTATPALAALATFTSNVANPTQVQISQLNNTVAPLTLSVGASGGATEIFTASGAALAGASNGSGGAPGTLGPFAPSWVMQEPQTYPIQNTWSRGMRPNAQPWGCSSDQPPRYYWRGGRVGIVPNTLTAGIEISIDCVRSPDLITVPNQIMTAPYDFLPAIAADAIRQAYMGSADPKSLQLAQMWESAYLGYEKEILQWRGTFEGEASQPPRMLTQRSRMGLSGSRLHKR
jgi:hypothetical protein